MGETTLIPLMAGFADELEKLAMTQAPPRLMGHGSSMGASPISVPQNQPNKPNWMKAGLIGAGALGAGALGYRFAPGLLRGLQGGAEVAGKGFASRQGFKQMMSKGWQSMAGTGNTTAMQDLSQQLAKHGPGAFMNRYGHLARIGKDGKLIARSNKTMADAYRGGGAGSVVNELSRRGWTGKGPIGKYAPLGWKSMSVGFPLAFLPGELKKGDPHLTGQGRGERVGKLTGESLGFVAGMPIGAAAGNKAYQAALKGAGTSRMGKWMALGSKGRGMPMIAGTMLTGALGGMIGRAAGRPVDMVTGERREAQARKGLKKYLDFRQRQEVQHSRAAAQQQSGAY
jgi:hypothetical protein